MLILWILIPCLACGALFAYLAAWLTTKKGNTISDVLNSQKFSDSEAIEVEILDKLKVSSNLPIVALFIVASPWPFVFRRSFPGRFCRMSP